MRTALFILAVHALSSSSSVNALEHDYFASYYGNEGQGNSNNNNNKWEDPNGVRRQDSPWPGYGGQGQGGPPPGHYGDGGDGPDSKIGGEEIYWGPNPPSFGGGHYGYGGHGYPPMTTTTTTTTTKAPPPKDTGQRVSKKPYSYYFLGRKLWYIPLYFAIYYTIYVGALIIKAIARHRVNLPAGYGRESGSVGLSDIVGKAIQEFGQKYM